MAVRSRRKPTMVRFIAPLMTLVILGYFGFHAFNGQYGIRANLLMQKRMVELQDQLQERTQRRALLEDRVALLRRGRMEKDMVDQHVRSQLNMLRQDEVVLFLSK